MKILLFTLALIFSIQLSAEPFDSQVNHQPETKVQIKMDTNDYPHYKKLARSVHLDTGVTFGYQDYVNVIYTNRLGSGDHHETLLLSTGLPGDPEAKRLAEKAYLHWETVYFQNDNMTIIHAVRLQDGHRSVRLMKLAKGRITDLHLR